MTSWRVRLGLIAAFVSAIAAVAMAETDAVRSLAFRSGEHCLRTLLFDTPHEVEVVLIGSSRIQQGVRVGPIAAALDTPPERVANAGHPWLSMPLYYAIIEEIAERQPLRMVVMEVIARSPAQRAQERSVYPRGNAKFDLHLTSGSYEHLYVAASSADEQIRRLWRDSDHAVLAAWDITRILSERLVNFLSIFTDTPTQLKWALTGHGDPAEDAMDTSQTTACFHKYWDYETDPDTRRAALHKARREDYAETFGQDGEKWVDPDPLGFIGAPTFAARHAAIDDLVALGREHGFLTVFLYLPSAHVPQPSSRLPEHFEARFGAPLVVPDQELRRRLADGGFEDQAHLNAKGRKIFTTWLGETLRAIELESAGQ